LRIYRFFVTTIIVIATIAKSGTYLDCSSVSQLIFQGQEGLPVRLKVSLGLIFSVPPKRGPKLPAIAGAREHSPIYENSNLAVMHWSFSDQSKIIFMSGETPGMSCGHLHNHPRQCERHVATRHLNEDARRVGRRLASRPESQNLQYFTHLAGQ